MNRSFFIVIILSLILPFAISAQTVADTQAYQDKLQAQYDQAQKDLQALNDQSDQIKSQKASLQRDISLIDVQIKQALAEIKVKTLAIDQLNKDIGVKQSTINDLQDKLDQSVTSLAGLIRRTNENDAVSLPDIILGTHSFSEFFNEVDSFQTIKDALNSSISDVKNFKQQTETEKTGLETKKDKETNAQQAIQADERTIERSKAEKNKILSVTKGQESGYAKLIENKERNIAQISTALFALRDSNGIQFGTALQYANIASQKTGVRPAFILAILTQETNLGKNLGSCYLRDYETGDGISVTTGADKPRTMSPTRDIQTFLTITRGLGLNPQSQRVSCWIPMYSAGKPAGWGGAMGPAQFIPSTWDLFDQRIKKALGVNLANPWDPEHAILASSLFLSDLGAGTQTYSDEKNAACRYYSGRKCSAGTGSAYGASVMAKAQNIQECMIDPILGKSSGC